MGWLFAIYANVYRWCLSFLSINGTRRCECRLSSHWLCDFSLDLLWNIVTTASIFLVLTDMFTFYLFLRYKRHTIRWTILGMHLCKHDEIRIQDTSSTPECPCMPPASAMPEQSIHTRLFPTLCSEASHRALNPWWWEYLHDGNWQMAYNWGFFSKSWLLNSY